MDECTGRIGAIACPLPMSHCHIRTLVSNGLLLTRQIITVKMKYYQSMNTREHITKYMDLSIRGLLHAYM